MLLGHQHTAAWDEFVTLLAPDVDRALIQLILGRGALTRQRRDKQQAWPPLY
jgi:hypothetical protein